VSWGGLLNTNDLSLKLRDSNGNLRGESNYPNLPGLTGKREKITLFNQPGGILQAIVQHTAGTGTTQNFFGAVEVTRAEYAPLKDLNNLSFQWQEVIKDSIRNYLVIPDGNRFRPTGQVTRAELATSLLRGGRVPQYIAGNPIFQDVRDLTTRNVVESIHSNPGGKLFYDAQAGSPFRPENSATRLLAAVALVKAAGLQNQAFSATLTTGDALMIPSEYRGFVAVALSKGLLLPENGNFVPNRSLTRAELAAAMVRLTKLASE
jgi:hypothetical protein